METSITLTRTQKEILGFMSHGRELKCWGDPATTSSVWIPGDVQPVIRIVSRKTMLAMLSAGLIQVFHLGEGPRAPKGHTVMLITAAGKAALEKGKKSRNPPSPTNSEHYPTTPPIERGP